MTVLNNSVKPVATDRFITRNSAKLIACSFMRCNDSATWTYFFADGSVARRCKFHGSHLPTGAYAHANHSPILVDDIAWEAR